MTRRSTWPVWAGLLLTVIAVFSYMAVFVNFPLTRDVPWATFLLFAIALVLVALGLRGAFQAGSSRGKKIVSSIGAVLSVLVVGLFVFGFYFGSRLPVSNGAPRVGQKAPEFRLSDSNGHLTALSELLTTPLNGIAPRGVLLVFYRGYW